MKPLSQYLLEQLIEAYEINLHPDGFQVMSMNPTTRKVTRWAAYKGFSMRVKAVGDTPREAVENLVNKLT